MAAPACRRALAPRAFPPHRAASTSAAPRPTSVADFVVIGAGIIGINVAAVLRARRPAARILVLDKEPAPGLHASGRNSGVLHAGFYYAPGSHKAALTAEGNAFLTSYCAARGLPLRRCGKLVVARNEGELDGLDTLFTRGRANGVRLEEVTAEGARALEPLALTHKRALWSPDTSAGDPAAVLRAQVADVVAAGVEVRFNAPVAGLAPARTGGGGMVVQLAGGAGAVEAGHVVNCAGLHADTLAHAAGFGAHLTLLPFKGLYLYCDIPLARLVYPVPDLSKPFLGVHFTVTFDGRSKIGPTAIPALWREQYGGREGMWKGFSAAEMVQALALEASLFATQADFRALALAEVKKYRRAHMVAGAGELVAGGGDLARYAPRFGAAGIRAQLMDTRSRKLVMDYVVEGDGASTHVLNAVSPAWTCSRPFAQLVVARVLGDTNAADEGAGKGAAAA